MYNLFDMLTVVYKYKKLYERKCSSVMKKYDLRIADLDILYYIAHSGRKNLARDIADTGMSKANVSKSVEHLRRKGLVALSEDAEDRRCLHIEATDAALPVIHDIAMVREEMGESLSRGIAQEDKEAVVRVMSQIGENMNSELMNMIQQ